jgi:hypothetical protein
LPQFCALTKKFFHNIFAINRALVFFSSAKIEKNNLLLCPMMAKKYIFKEFHIFGFAKLWHKTTDVFSFKVKWLLSICHV